MKISPTLGFEGGSITIRAEGYADRNGSAYLVFADEDLDYEQDDGPLYRIANVEASELIEIRDWLNKWLPASADRSGEAGETGSVADGLDPKDESAVPNDSEADAQTKAEPS